MANPFDVLMNTKTDREKFIAKDSANSRLEKDAYNGDEDALIGKKLSDESARRNKKIKIKPSK